MTSTRSARKQEAIVAAARTVFLHHGYRAASMDQVAAEAKVSKVTIYSHFADKRALFTEVVTFMVAESESREPLEADRVGPDLARWLRRLARETLNTVLDPAVIRMRRVIIACADEFPDLSQVWYEQTIQRTYEELAELFEGLTRTGRLQAHDPMTAAQQFLWLVLSVPLNQAMFLGNAKAPTARDVRRFADQGVQAFLAAYGAAK